MNKQLLANKHAIEILNIYKRVGTYEVAAEVAGISRQRVHQILKTYGYLIPKHKQIIGCFICHTKKRSSDIACTKCLMYINQIQTLLKKEEKIHIYAFPDKCTGCDKEFGKSLRRKAMNLCVRCYDFLRYNRNPQRKLEAKKHMKKYHDAHKEQTQARNRKYHQEHKEERAAYMKARRMQLLKI